MVAIIKPRGAIPNKEVRFKMCHPNGHFYIIDIYGSRLEISKEVYESLKEVQEKE